MKEIIVKDNNTGLKVYINGIPNLRLIPKDEAEIVITALEEQISNYYEMKLKEKSDSVLVITPTYQIFYTATKQVN